jgi:putative oxidoreductase
MAVPDGEVEEKEVDSMIQLFEKYYRLLIRISSSLQSPFLLAVRLYWGWQFMQTGWGKLSDIGKVVGFFTDLGIPAPALNAYFVSALEFGGGILLILGLGSRLIALPLVIDMIGAYITADREALLSIFSNPDKFTAAAPYTFLVASLIVLIFGPGKFSLDALLAARIGDRQVQSPVDGGSRVVVQH